MDKASEAIFALQPVTFRYKKELDPEGIPQFGLMAEDRRHSDARHEQTQRLARWAIGIGIVGIFSAVVAIVFGIANRSIPQDVPAAATETAQTPAVIPPTPAALPTTTPTPAALLTTTPTPAAAPTMSVVTTRTPTTKQKKTRRTRHKRPTPPPSFWDRLFKPKPTI
jgi:hypothetical protein